MTDVSIHRDASGTSEVRYRAVAGNHQSTGRTAGEALDALNARLGPAESGSLVVVQQFQSDPFFSEEQFDRMRHLLDHRDTLNDTERIELEALVKEELTASAKRTEALADALGR